MIIKALEKNKKYQSEVGKNERKISFEEYKNI